MIATTIDNMHPTISKLMRFSRERGWMSYEELNTALPDEYIRPDKMDELMILINECGLELTNYLDLRSHRGPHFYGPLQTNLRFKRDNPKRTFKLATEEEILEQEAAEEARKGSRRNAAFKDASMLSKDLVGRVFVQLVSIRST